MPGVKATWEPYEEHGGLTTRNDLPDSVFAFPRLRKEPLTDAQHVRDAIARFDQVIDVPDADRIARVQLERCRTSGLRFGPRAAVDVHANQQT